MLTYIQQNGPTGQNIKYPSKVRPGATIASGGCGVCSSLMVLLNSTSYSIKLADWTKKVIACGGRDNSGTNMVITTNMMKDKYGFKVETTTSIDKLKAHLKKGYKAVLNVGQRGYFSTGGHYVCAAGITPEGKAIVLDPYYYAGKWTCYANGINRANHFTYNSTTHEVYCSFDVISKDRRSYYWLLTPTKKVSVKYSPFDAHAVTATVKPAAKKSLEAIAKEVIDGKWGVGDDRVKALTKAGYNAAAVQKKVNELLKPNTSKKKSNAVIAKEVIDGKWGNGDARKKKLTAAGYNYNAIQKEVNKLLK